MVQVRQERQYQFIYENHRPVGCVPGYTWQINDQIFCCFGDKKKHLRDNILEPISNTQGQMTFQFLARKRDQLCFSVTYIAHHTYHRDKFRLSKISSSAASVCSDLKNNRTVRIEAVSTKYQALDCNPGRFGVQCNETCSRNCMVIHSCNTVTGACDNGCKPGWKMPQCTTCEDGRFGTNCDMLCSDNCMESCSKDSGNCLQGCKPGWKGDTCNNGDSVPLVLMELDAGRNAVENVWTMRLVMQLTVTVPTDCEQCLGACRGLAAVAEYPSAVLSAF
ncbi:hypothetical protein B566_EDAN012651 [Ephemera danica]|nr:hypothetical protein B566_EDAN012651 [Ephemera danica]